MSDYSCHTYLCRREHLICTQDICFDTKVRLRCGRFFLREPKPAGTKNFPYEEFKSMDNADCFGMLAGQCKFGTQN